MSIEYPIYFISSNEPNQEKNWQKTKSSYPTAKRICNQGSLLEAHQYIHHTDKSEKYWTIDADNIIQGYDLSIIAQLVDSDENTHIWPTINSINRLYYHHGGLKLWNRNHMFLKEYSGLSFEYNVSMAQLTLHPDILSVHDISGSPFQAYSSAIKETTGLTLELLSSYRKKSNIVYKNLMTWCSVGQDSENGIYAILGARRGMLHALTYVDSKKLFHVKNTDYVQECFNEDITYSNKNHQEQASYMASRIMKYNIVTSMSLFDSEQSQFIKDYF